MKLTAKAQEVAAQILAAFKSGAVPKALALTFLARHHDFPCHRWSWRNRLIVALSGHADARGFRQWQAAALAAFPLAGQATVLAAIELSGPADHVFNAVENATTRSLFPFSPGSHLASW